MHVCFVLTTPFALNAFVAPVIRALINAGWQVTVITNATNSEIVGDLESRIEVIDMDIARAIAPWQDMRILWRLVRLFRTRRFDIVHSLMPKTGLLAMVASYAVGVPVRIHTFTGQVWATRRGPMRWFLRLLDRILALCATALLADSVSQRDFLVNEKVVVSGRIQVLGQGSVTGVDTARFKPEISWRSEMRRMLSIPAEAVLALYMGRMQKDKGLAELALAFSRVASKLPNIHLLLVGPDEGALAPALWQLSSWSDRVHVVGLTPEPEKYMAAADIFCLASYREGFGLSLIEAASAGLPSVASRIYGLTDAVIEGVTGLFVPAGNVDALAEAIQLLSEQPCLRLEMGAAARRRAEKDFPQKLVVQAWLAFYHHQATLRP